VGCPTNAKQSMLVTTIPAALNRGATLRTPARRAFALTGDRVERARLHGDAAGRHPSCRQPRAGARPHFVLAGRRHRLAGAAAAQRRAGPFRLLGRRTFLHPVVISSALMPDRVDAYAGAPQSIYSDHFLQQAPIDGPLGFKLETPPLHPILYSTTLQGFGEAHARLMREFTRVNALLALLRDGFHPESRGGQVRLGGRRSAGARLSAHEVIWEGARRALLAMAEIQFAAGARWVTPVHETSPGYTSWAEAKKGISELPLKPLLCRVVSAHVMGGCAMAGSPQRGVVDHRGRHYWLANLSVHDGSVFPTSLGANPQLSIYGLVARNASLLAAELSGKPTPVIP
jgi:hypothetical protein